MKLEKKRQPGCTYIASVSAGKDSLAMVLRIMEEGYPLDYAVFYDKGMEFDSIYANLERLRKILFGYGAELVILKPEISFLTEMLIKPIRGKNGEHYGYDWCGGKVRWRMSDMIQRITSFTDQFDKVIQYVGIAADETWRPTDKEKIYPLKEWGMTEADCLRYCFDHGWSWDEDGKEIYDYFSRSSCWCCNQKRIGDYRNMYHFFPKYWGLLKGMQSRIDRPFWNGLTVFQLEERFKAEDAQMTIFDIWGDCREG